MSLIGTFILTTAISITASRSPASNEGDAYRALTKATFLQTGVDVKVKEFEEEYINEDVRKYTGWTMIVIKISSEKRIGYEWKF